MMKERTRAVWALGVGLALTMSCGDDQPERQATSSGKAGSFGSGAVGGRAGSAGAPGGGTAGQDGSAGAPGGGTAGQDGSAGRGPDDAGRDRPGDPADAGPDAAALPLNPHGIAVVAPALATPDAGPADTATAKPRLLVAGSDFTTRTQITTIDLALESVGERIEIAEGDAVPVASGGQGFVLGRGKDKLYSLTPSGAIDKVIDMASPGSASPDAGIRSKGYVPLYNTTRIAVVDLEAGAVSHGIDLAAYNHTADADGRPEIDLPVYVPSAGRVYFVLSRLDLGTIDAQGKLPCPVSTGLLIAVDTATDRVADLNGTAAGDGIELSLVNPTAMLHDVVSNRLLILNAGCHEKVDGGQSRRKHGVEAVNLASGQAGILLSARRQEFMGQFFLVGAGEALISAFGDELFDAHWYRWHVGAPNFWAELLGVPAAVNHETSGNLIGLEVSKLDAGSQLALIRYAISTGTLQTVLSTSWTTGLSVSAAALVE